MSMESQVNGNYEEHRRNVVNAELAEAARDTVDLLSRRIMPLIFERVQAMLDQDREEIDVYALSDAQPGTSAELYISQDMIDAPSRSGNFQETLSLLLGGENSEDNDLVEALRVYIPINRDNYVYPDPLDQYDDMPTELYFDFMPYGKEGVGNQRFVIKEDLLDIRNRFRIFKYDSSADGLEEHVYDTISDFQGHIDPSTFTKFKRGLPPDTNLAVWLVDLMARLPESIQKEVSIREE